MSLWNNIKSIDSLVLNCDTSQKPLPGKILPCLLCAKPYLQRYYSGRPDQLCPECHNVYDECARIICSQCKVTVARAKPGLTDSGFHIRRRAVLHLDACNVCQTGIKESVVIEVDLWEKQVGRTKTIVLATKYTKIE
jgi:hypothetical protein